MRRYLRVSFLGPVVFGLFVSLVSPPLGIWLVVGLGVVTLAAVGPKLAQLWSNRAEQRRIKPEQSAHRDGHATRSRKSIGILGALVALLGVLIGGLAIRQSPPERGRLERTVPVERIAKRIELRATVEATAQLAPSRHALQVNETLLVPAMELREQSRSFLANFADPHVTEFALARAMLRGLRRAGWQAEASTAAIDATTTVFRPVHQHELIPGLTSNTLYIAPPSNVGDLESLPINITVGQGSELRIKVPTFTIASTDPSSEPATTVHGQEERVVALHHQDNTIDYEVRSTFFRNDLLAFVTNVTVWTPFKWLLLLIVSAASEELRGALCTSVKRLARRRTLEPSATSSAGEESSHSTAVRR
jgi:hypothetical protein